MNKILKYSGNMKSNKINICILGGGNIGTLLLADIGRRKNVSLRLLTSKPSKWKKQIEVWNSNEYIEYIGEIDYISNNPSDVIVDADIIISTLPSHIFPDIINKIKPFIKRGAWIGIMPGSGGCEFYCKELIEDGCLVFGFQRVHGIARTREYGKSVYDLGKKSEIYISTIPTKHCDKVCNVIEGILKVKCCPLPNFLNVTLTPSNPILHTTRLYTMFKKYKEGMYWDREIDFYSDWTDDSSKMLISCDDELQKLCKKISGLDLSGIKSLKEHYESEDHKKMTQKISNIVAFKGIKTPMIKTERGYIPNFSSRYFLEDFPYGLAIIKGFCDIANVNTPSIDRVLRWFEKIVGVEYFIDGQFDGKDLKFLPMPRHYGLNSINDIEAYYK